MTTVLIRRHEAATAADSVGWPSWFYYSWWWYLRSTIAQAAVSSWKRIREKGADSRRLPKVEVREGVSEFYLVWLRPRCHDKFSVVISFQLSPIPCLQTFRLAAFFFSASINKKTEFSQPFIHAFQPLEKAVWCGLYLAILCSPLDSAVCDLPTRSRSYRPFPSSPVHPHTGLLSRAKARCLPTFIHCCLVFIPSCLECSSCFSNVDFPTVAVEMSQ